LSKIAKIKISPKSIRNTDKPKNGCRKALKMDKRQVTMDESILSAFISPHEGTILSSSRPITVKIANANKNVIFRFYNLVS
jgi:hypothetical protein